MGLHGGRHAGQHVRVPLVDAVRWWTVLEPTVKQARAQYGAGEFSEFEHLAAEGRRWMAKHGVLEFKTDPASITARLVVSTPGQQVANPARRMTWNANLGVHASLKARKEGAASGIDFGLWAGPETHGAESERREQIHSPRGGRFAFTPTLIDPWDLTWSVPNWGSPASPGATRTGDSGSNEPKPQDASFGGTANRAEDSHDMPRSTQAKNRSANWREWWR